MTRAEILRLPPEPEVSRETQERLAALRDLLLLWNTRINLVAERDPATIDQRHIRDSLQLLPFLPPHGPIADFGSGAYANVAAMRWVPMTRRNLIAMLSAALVSFLPRLFVAMSLDELATRLFSILV